MHVQADLHKKYQEEQEQDEKENSPAIIPIKRKVKKLKHKMKLPK